jgi:hypothetical protein
VLRPGWCVMQSRFLIGGMAAVPDGEGTRFAFLGGIRLPGIRLLDPVLRLAAQSLALRPIRRLEERLAAGQVLHVIRCEHAMSPRSEHDG